MTYLESYLKCKDKEEFTEKWKKDVKFAMFINPDRIALIEKSINEVAKIHPEWVGDFYGSNIND